MVKLDFTVRNSNPAVLWLLTGKEHELETLGQYYRQIRYLWKVANTSNCILIYNVGSLKRYNMALLKGVDIFKI